MREPFNVKIYNKDELLESFTIDISLKSMLVEARQLSLEKKTVVVKEYYEGIYIKKYLFYNGQKKHNN